MSKGTSFVLLMAAGLFLAAEITGAGIAGLLDWRAFTVLLVYAGTLVVIRHTPGICFYRMVVLAEPERHIRPELERARSFAAFTGERFLFAGLIFTLGEVALILAHSPVSAYTASLVAALPTALYALFFYALAVRAARAAAAFAKS